MGQPMLLSAASAKPIRPRPRVRPAGLHHLDLHAGFEAVDVAVVARRPSHTELNKSWRRARELGLKFETTTFERRNTLGMPALLEV